MSEASILIGAGVVLALFVGVFLLATIILRRRHPVDKNAVPPVSHGSGLEDAHSWHMRQHD
jgi:hypothetical protein